jgi:CBS domain-containing protein
MIEVPRIKVEHLMSTELVTLEKGDSLEKLLKTIETYDYNSYPVLHEGELVGIVEKVDLLRVLKRDVVPEEFFYTPIGTKDLTTLLAKQVGDIMTRKVFTVSPEDGLEEAVLQMLKHDVRNLPVVKDGKLVGIITCGDVLSRLLF